MLNESLKKQIFNGRACPAGSMAPSPARFPTWLIDGPTSGANLTLAQCVMADERHCPFWLPGLGRIR